MMRGLLKAGHLNKELCELFHQNISEINLETLSYV